MTPPTGAFIRNVGSGTHSRVCPNNPQTHFAGRRLFFSAIIAGAFGFALYKLIRSRTVPKKQAVDRFREKRPKKVCKKSVESNSKQGVKPEDVAAALEKVPQSDKDSKASSKSSKIDLSNEENVPVGIPVKKVMTDEKLKVTSKQPLSEKKTSSISKKSTEVQSKKVKKEKRKKVKRVPLIDDSTQEASDQTSDATNNLEPLKEPAKDPLPAPTPNSTPDSSLEINPDANEEPNCTPAVPLSPTPPAPASTQKEGKTLPLTSPLTKVEKPKEPVSILEHASAPMQTPTLFPKSISNPVAFPVSPVLVSGLKTTKLVEADLPTEETCKTAKEPTSEEINPSAKKPTNFNAKGL